MPAFLAVAAGGFSCHAVWESTYQVYYRASRGLRAGPAPLGTRHGLRAFAIDESLDIVGGCTTALRGRQVVDRLRLAS